MGLVSVTQQRSTSGVRSTQVVIKGNNDGIGTVSSTPFNIPSWKSGTLSFSMTGDQAAATITRTFWNNELYSKGDNNYHNEASAADGSGEMFNILEADEELGTSLSMYPGGEHSFDVTSNNGTSDGDWTAVFTFEN